MMRVAFNEIFSIFIHLSCTVPISLQALTKIKSTTFIRIAKKELTDVKKEQGNKKQHNIIVLSNVVL